jgi:Rps23 Pro-64 3,4-dihydroxylase Tpa1-like proline 4-hydroxylase
LRAVLELLNPDLKSRDLSREFAQAQPFRHIVVDSFLTPQFCERLLAEFPAFEDRKAINEMGVVGRKAVVSDIVRIGPAYQQFDRLMRDPQFLELMGTIAGIPKLVYDPEYVGGGTHENLHGQDLDLHVDFNYHPHRMLHRRLNLIVFLNPEWTESWGGCLELHKDPWTPGEDQVTKVTPVLNRAVMFETTERSWHGFSRIGLPAEKQHISRKSVAVYFYTRERPATEMASPHGTVYVPWPLPPHIEAGYTLTQEDVDSLHILLERRNAQIRFLYERELEFSQAISGMTRSLSFRLGRALTWPVRKLLK